MTVYSDNLFPLIKFLILYYVNIYCISSLNINLFKVLHKNFLNKLCKFFNFIRFYFNNFLNIIHLIPEKLN